MSDYLHKGYNDSVLIYRMAGKNRRSIFDDTVDTELRDICLEIAKRYEIEYFEIDIDKGHVNFLV